MTEKEKPEVLGKIQDFFREFYQEFKKDPRKTLSKPIKKYTFGFRTGSNFHDALQKDSDTTLKDATVESIKDTAKSTTNIIASKTIFSMLKLAFVESAVGSMIMSSTLMISLKGGFALFMATFSQTMLGVFLTSLSATITVSFVSIATTLLTLIAGSQLGRLISSTTLGSLILGICWKLVGLVASVIPMILGTIILGYAYKFYKSAFLDPKKEQSSDPVTAMEQITEESL